MVKKSMKKLFVGLAVVTSATAFASSGSASESLSSSKGFFQPRAASANIAREMMMQPSGKYKNSEGWYGEFSATAFYQRNWNQSPVSTGNTNSANASSVDIEGLSSLGALPFWSGTNVMTVGTNVEASTSAPTTLASLDAWQFGLGNLTVTTTPATITLNPIVYQAGSDFMFIFGSSEDRSGFFAKVKAPVATYNINPQLTEQNALPAADYPAGTLAANTVPTYSPATTMTQAFAGITGDAVAQGDYSVLQNGLIDGDLSTGARLGDMEITVGYRMVSDKNNSFCLAARIAAPTGNKATGKYMLEPIVGRGGNWGLGGYTAGHVKLWEGNNDKSLSFQFMADAMHLFSTTTKRSYDLTVNGAGSRYLLVANYQNNVYQGQVQNLINYTTLDSSSSFAIEGDIALGFTYDTRGWTFDLGYEFYGRSVEKLSITGDFANQAYAVLGSQGIGFRDLATTASEACQPGATIGSSVAYLGGTTVPTLGVIATGTQIGNALTPGNRIALADLNQEAAAQDAYLTSKIFSKVAYEWEESKYVPFLGVLGEFEFSNCSNNALPQWSVAVVGGVSF